MSNSTVHEVSSKDEILSTLQETGNSSFVIDFYSNSCPPCKAIAPKYADLAAAYPKITFFKVNLSELLSSCASNGKEKMAYAEGISMIPCFKFFKDSQASEPVFEFMGANKDNLEIGIQKLLSNE